MFQFYLAVTRNEKREADEEKRANDERARCFLPWSLLASASAFRGALGGASTAASRVAASLRGDPHTAPYNGKWASHASPAARTQLAIHKTPKKKQQPAGQQKPRRKVKVSMSAITAAAGDPPLDFCVENGASEPVEYLAGELPRGGEPNLRLRRSLQTGEFVGPSSGS